MSRRNDPNAEIEDFIAIKGPWTLKITPQTPRGWRAALMWMLILLAPTLPYLALAIWVDDTPREIWAIWMLIPLLLLNGLTIWAMIRWTLKRATIVTLEELQSLTHNRRPGTRDPRR